MTTIIPTPAPVPDPLSSDFGTKTYDFTVWMAEAAPAMQAVGEEMNAALNNSLLGVTSSSTTSLLIGTGSKTLTVGTGLGYALGMPLKLASAANVANYMKGVVTAYNSVTGSLTINIASIGGSGTFADWAVSFDIPDTALPKLPELVRTSNIMLTNADSGSFLSMTGTFTQTHDTGNFTTGWYVFKKNAGTGEITIAASDSRTNWVMYPGEIRLFRWNGTTLVSEIIQPFYFIGAASGNFIKAPGYRMFDGLLWGAGSSGTASRYITGNIMFQGGTAGACHKFSLLAVTMSDTEPYVIGAGGAVATAPAASYTGGNAGGNSTFCGLISYGGAGPSGGYSYGGSGSMSAGALDGSGGAPNGGVHFSDASGATTYRKMLYNSQYGGSKAGVATVVVSGSATYDNAFAGNSYYGGAGSGACYGNGTNYTTTTPNGNSIYGATAGQSIFTSGAPSQFLGASVGTTKFGGFGGAAALGTGAQVGTAGGVRGGGGGAACSTDNVSAVSGVGGRGEIRIWGVV